MRKNICREVILLTLIILCSLTISQAAEEGLIGYWDFGEGSGKYANDTSGNSNTGTVHGAIRVDGKFGKALSFI